MRLKGISPFEQHVEKFVVAAFAAVLLGVLAWQFVGPQNQVRVGDRDVPIDQGYNEVAQQAQRVMSRVGDPNPPLPEAEGATGELGTFAQRMAPRIDRSRTLAWAGTRGSIAIDAVAGGGELIQQIPDITLPAPSQAFAAVHMATIDPREVQQTPELAEFLPRQNPMDKAAVSVETRFSGEALRRALDTGENGIPRHWWEGTVQILGVEVERSELRDGDWSDPAPVRPMPGRMNLLTELGNEVTPSELREVAGQAAEFASVVRRPRYLAVMMGEPWAPPSEVAQRVTVSPADQARVDGLRRELASLDDEIERVQTQLGRNGGGGGGAGGGPGGGGGGRGTPGGGGGGGGGGGAPTADDRIRQQLEARLARAQQNRERIAGQLVELGAGPQAAQVAGQPGETPPTDPPLLQDPNVRVWAHDLTAQRGGVYRYRVRLVLSNPLFGRDAAIPEPQRSLAASPVVRTPPSEWSAPVQVAQELYYFITNAQDAGLPLGPGPQLVTGPRASAEIFAFRWGYWRRGTVSLEPGDTIRGEVEVPNLEPLLAALDAPAPDQPGGEGGGRGMVPNDPGAANAGQQAQIPEGQIQMRREPVSGQAFLLDVAAVPAVRQRELAGQAATSFQAVLKDTSGRLVVRIPERDRETPEYTRVVQSFRQGQTALQPRREAAEQGPDRGPRQPDPRQPTPPPGGGGGGGGGGG